jgi:heptosyltransferase-2
VNATLWDRVLVVQTSFLGDTVLTLPLLAEIKRRFPTAKLSLLCTRQSAELLRGHCELDEIIIDDKKGADKGWLGLWRKAEQLRTKGFTLALSPHKSLRSALLLFLAGIPYRVGFRQSNGWFLFHARANRDPSRHDVERNLSILEPLGIGAQQCRRDLELPPARDAETAVDEIFRSAAITIEKPIIGVNPGSVWSTKKWPAESFARLVSILKAETDCTIVLFGAPEDVPTIARIMELTKDAAVSFAGKIALSQLPAALRRCSILVTNDSGPMHIAVARGVAIVAVFCATTPSLGFYPYSSRAVVVEKDLPCRPCSSHGGRRCPLGTEDCMRLIPAEAVAEAVKSLLATVPDGRRSHGKDYEPAYMRL